MNKKYADQNNELLQMITAAINRITKNNTNTVNSINNSLNICTLCFILTIISKYLLIILSTFQNSFEQKRLKSLYSDVISSQQQTVNVKGVLTPRVLLPVRGQ